MSFTSFIINESKVYLGKKAGDILTSLQNLQDDMHGLGQRAIIRASQQIVNQIRKILHGSWDEQDTHFLNTLQKIGVAIMKAIDDNEDIKETIAGCVDELEGMLDNLKTPINSLGTESDLGNKEESEPFSVGSEI